MKSLPILFSTPMVRAILEGRKTQTRRIYKNRKHPDFGCDMAASELVREQQHVIDRMCPYGQPGDRLYVKETFRVGAKHDALPPRSLPLDRGLSIAYAAGGMMCRDEVGGPYISHPNDDLYDADWMGKTRVSIHMPRRASRITLEIVSVRVERLADISEADAMAEGCMPDIEHSKDVLDGWAKQFQYKAPYRRLWESINGPGSWAANPWVWVIEFKRIEA